MRQLVGLMLVIVGLVLAYSLFGSGIQKSFQGSQAMVNTQGYAFPIGLSKAEVSTGGSLPCLGICHHDGTPALDLAHIETVQGGNDPKTVGTPVYAIHAGTIQRLNNAYSGITGCASFQLVANDGWHYWYGHVAGVRVQDGETVAAGQEIARVGQRKCTGNGSYPHLHIDRGSPQGNDGGRECCRDAGLVPLINTLWGQLP